MNEDLLSESDPEVCTGVGGPRYPDDVRRVDAGRPLPEDIPMTVEEHGAACVQAVADSLRLLKLYVNPIELNFYIYKMLKYLRKVKQKDELESMKSEVSSSYYNRMGLGFNSTNMNHRIGCGDDTRSAFSRGFSRMEHSRNVSRQIHAAAPTLLPQHLPSAAPAAPAAPPLPPLGVQVDGSHHDVAGPAVLRSHVRPPPSPNTSVDTRKHDFDTSADSNSSAEIVGDAARDDEDEDVDDGGSTTMQPPQRDHHHHHRDYEDRQMMMLQQQQQQQLHPQRPAVPIRDDQRPVKQSVGYTNVSVVSQNNTFSKSVLQSNNANNTQPNNSLMSKLAEYIGKNKRGVIEKVPLYDITEEDGRAGASTSAGVTTATSAPKRPLPPKPKENEKKPIKRRSRTEIARVTEEEEEEEVEEPEKKVMKESKRGRPKKNPDNQQQAQNKKDSKPKTEPKTNSKNEQKSRSGPKAKAQNTSKTSTTEPFVEPSKPRGQNSSASKTKTKSAEPKSGAGAKKKTDSGQESTASKTDAEKKRRKAPAKGKTAAKGSRNDDDDGDEFDEKKNDSEHDNAVNTKGNIFEGFDISWLSLEGNRAISPGAVLNSAKKCCADDICGRQTPPTAIFGHVFGVNDPAGGYTTDHKSVVEDRPANRKQLVQRVSKDWKGGRTKKGNGKDTAAPAPAPLIMTDCADPEVDRIMAAAKSRSLRTPTILKQVFRSRGEKKKKRRRKDGVDAACSSSSNGEDEDEDDDDDDDDGGDSDDTT